MVFLQGKSQKNFKINFNGRKNMYVIVGLGNPKREYENTRHNIGFDVIDALADKYGISVKEVKHKAVTGKGIIEGKRVILVKPLTFMNLSGESVRQVLDFYKASPEEDLIVIADDISLDVGKIRINGLKNIILHTGTDGFQRIKMGVGEKPAGYDLADYVLGHFTKEERVVIQESIDNAVDAIRIMITEGADKAMNLYNKKNENQK